MDSAQYLTVGSVAELFGVETWVIRRIVDQLDDEVPRAGQYRLIPRELLRSIEVRLGERGYIVDPGADSEVHHV